MTILTVPIAVSDLLGTARHETEIRDELGRTIGTFRPALELVWESISPEVTDSDLDEIRISKTGLSTDELQDRLRSRRCTA